jgi:hypothetical protein
MPITEKELRELLGPGNYWEIEPPPQYELRVLNANWVIDNVRSCWTTHDTFREVAKSMASGQGYLDRRDKVLGLALANVVPILVPVFELGHLKKIWPDVYPTSLAIDDRTLIASDGNHRLAALAIRMIHGDPVSAASVGLFVAVFETAASVKGG